MQIADLNVINEVVITYLWFKRAPCLEKVEFVDLNNVQQCLGW